MRKLLPWNLGYWLYISYALMALASLPNATAAFNSFLLWFIILETKASKQRKYYHRLSVTNLPCCVRRSCIALHQVSVQYHCYAKHGTTALTQCVHT